MNYIFPTINAGVEMMNPAILVSQITNKMDGTCIVNVKISIAQSPLAKSAKFEIQLPDRYVYSGAQPITADIEAWAILEIAKFEV